MIVPKPVEGGNGLLRVAFVVVVDEGEALALAGDLVLGEEDPGDAAEGFEQLLEIVLLGVLAEVAHPDGGGVVPSPVGHGVAQSGASTGALGSAPTRRHILPADGGASGRGGWSTAGRLRTLAHVGQTLLERAEGVLVRTLGRPMVLLTDPEKNIYRYFCKTFLTVL